MRKLFFCLLGGWLSSLPLAAEAPLFRDFVGICGHTVNFRPDLYWPVCHVVRDYHPVEWDLQNDTSVLPEWPFAKNRVSWDQVYGSWRKKGFEITVCLQIDGLHEHWKDMERDSFQYAKSFAENFGPGGKWPHVTTVEIGNEPGLYKDEDYLKLHRAMARGIRAGNPKLKIATCNAEPGKSERYWKSIDLFKPIPELYDVLRIHRYAITEGWPVWRRSYPEDPKSPFLKTIAELVQWRDANAKEKPVWVSEFGWDASTQTPDPKGDMAKFLDTPDDEQARWIVRSYFLLAEMGVSKAFVFFFNDEDKPSFHAASGLTRNFQPKPSYHAVAWMLKSLENHRFVSAEKNSLTDGYVYKFAPEKSSEPSIYAVWHANAERTLAFSIGDGKLEKSELLPLSKEPAKAGTASQEGSHLKVIAGPTPELIWVR